MKLGRVSFPVELEVQIEVETYLDYEHIVMFHPSVANVLQYFDYRHLPEHLAQVSRQFAELAFRIAKATPSSPEVTVALRKLLEAKDAAVRATKGDGDPNQICLEVMKDLNLINVSSLAQERRVR